MKGLRSPWVTGVLVVVAFAVVFYQVIKPQWGRIRLRRSPPTTQAVPPTTTPSPAVTGSKFVPNPGAPLAVAKPETPLEGDSLPRTPIDYSAAKERYKRWVEAPQRDPFILVPPAPAAEDSTVAQQGPSPIAGWKLKGIWRQTGARFAAINSGIYREGEMCQGFKIAKIENDQVWVAVSNRLERLIMSYLAPGTNAAPRAPAPRR